MYSKLYDKYSELKNEFSAKDFGMYYVVNKPEMQEYNITPSFVLFTKDGAYDILMEKSKVNFNISFFYIEYSSSCYPIQ